MKGDGESVGDGGSIGTDESDLAESLQTVPELGFQVYQMRGAAFAVGIPE